MTTSPAQSTELRRLATVLLEATRARTAANASGSLRECEAAYGAFAEASAEYEDASEPSVVLALLDEVDALRAQLEAPYPCDICCGVGLRSGTPCVCGGPGTPQYIIHGLRVRVREVELDLDRMNARVEIAEADRKEAVRALRQSEWKATQNPDDHRLSGAGVCCCPRGASCPFSMREAQ